MDHPLLHDLRRLVDANAMTEDPVFAPVLERHREARGRSPYRTVPYVAVAPDDGEVFALDGDAGLPRQPRIAPAQHPGRPRPADHAPAARQRQSFAGGLLLVYLLFDADFFAAASGFGRRDAQRWVEQNPDLWRTDAPPDPADGESVTA